MNNKQKGKLENQVYSNRVLRSEFDHKWRTTIADSGYVIYTAIDDDASITVTLQGGLQKLLLFNKGGKVLVGGGGTSHYSKPHIAIDL
ncbi:hypothetical protein MH117_14955 [Paenibacillus sp. ACRRX]|uniref:hypothetical protein n=1 Tax=unclassified Paenibacillus TaxID=185978 RepID=UPI001EF535E8|nr:MULTISPECIES: hypothetical protein [unclassified Paenibacillus]MCG7408729.1 hypothetical protein [Paenibacillus sp. ACRRX]MDK8183496.1 hypothetical protein [Paenibacillus sp. UMB4589-SE434]